MLSPVALPHHPSYPCALRSAAPQALPPEDISFVPLKQTQEFKAGDLLQVGCWGWC